MNQLVSEYDQDFYQWTQHNAQLLREGKLAEIDILHIAEELESMGKRDKRELISRLTVLLAHLLKWQFQPLLRSKSWQFTVREQQEGILEAYPDALDMASDETGLPLSTFPEVCPYSIEQLLDKTFYPATF